MFIMEQKSIFMESIWKVFEVFSDEPLKIHLIKQISKKIKLAPTSVKLHLKKLEEKNLVNRKKGEQFFGYIANRENKDFLFYKEILNLIKMHESKVIDYIVNEIHPRTIVLYGSYLKGEDIEESDIDLLIVSKAKKSLELEKFEKRLKRKMHILVEEGLKKINKNLKAEVRNGLVLYGYLEND